MAIDVARLQVTITSSGGRRASREISGVGRAAIVAGQGVNAFGRNLSEAGRRAIRSAGMFGALRGRLDAVDDEFDAVGRSAGLASRGIGMFQRAASGALGAVIALRSRLDSLDDEFDQVGRSAMTASGSVQAFSASSTMASLAQVELEEALLYSAVPALIAYGSALGPLAANLGGVTAGALGLASGFGTVLGTGLLAWTWELVEAKKAQMSANTKEINRLNALKIANGGLTDSQQARLEVLKEQNKKLAEEATISYQLVKIMKDLRDSIMEVVAPFGKQFIPLVKAGVNALPELIRRILETAGSMQPFVNELQRLGSAAMTVIPRVTAWFFELGRDSIPMWRRFTRWVGVKTPEAIRFLGWAASETFAEFHELGLATLGLMRDLTKLGVVVTNLMIPGLSELFRKIGDGIDWFISLDKRTQKLILTLTTLAPIILAVSVIFAKVFTIVGPLLASLTSLSGILGLVGAAFGAIVSPATLTTAAIGAFAYAYLTNFADIRWMTHRVIGVIKDEFLLTLETLKTVGSPIISHLAKAFGLAGGDIEYTLYNVLMVIQALISEGIELLGSATRSVIRRLGALYWKHADTVEAIGARVNSAWGRMANFFEDAAYSQENLWVQIYKAVRRNVTRVLTDIDERFCGKSKSLIEKTFAAIVEVLRGDWSAAKTITMRILSQILGVAKQHATSLAGLIKATWARIRTTIQQKITQVLTDIDQRFCGKSKSLIEKTFAAIVEVLRGDWSAAKAITMRILAQILGVTKQHATSLRGIIEATWQRIRTVIQQKITQVLTDIDQRFCGKSQSLVEVGLAALVEIIRGKYGEVRTIVGHALDLIVQKVRSAILKSIPTDVKEGFRRVSQSIRSHLAVARQHVDAFLARAKVGYQMMATRLDAINARLTRIITDTWTRVKRTVGTVLDTLGIDVDELKQSVIKFAPIIAGMGAAFVLARGKILGAITVLVLAAKKFGVFKKAARLVPGALTGIRTAIAGLTRAMNGPLLGTLGTVGSRFVGFAGGTGPAALLAAAFVTLALGVSDNMDTVKRTVNQSLGAVKGAFVATNRAIKNQFVIPMQTSGSETNQTLKEMKSEAQETFSGIRAFAGQLVRRLSENFVPFVNRLARIWKQNFTGKDGIVANAREAMNAIWRVVKPALDRLQVFWSKHGEDIINIVDGVFGTIGTIIEIALDLILTSINVTLDLIAGDWEGAWNNIRAFHQRTWTALSRWVRTAGKKLLTGAINLVIALIEAAWSNLKKTVTDLIKDLIIQPANWVGAQGKKTIRNAFSKVTGAIEGVWKDLKTTVSNIIDDIVSTIKRKVRGVLDWVKRVWNDAIPSKVTFEAGFKLPELTLGGGEFMGKKVPSKTIGGGRYGLNKSVNLPQLDTGGFITGDGLAVLHEGEQVLTAAEVDRAREAPEGGNSLNGDINIYVENGDRRTVRRGVSDALRQANFNH